MRKLWFSIGISGSGKSYYYKNKFLLDFKEVNEFLISKKLTLFDITVSPDDIRREVCGDVSDMSKDGYVWKLADLRLKENLDVYGYCIFDATGISAKGRKFLKNVNAYKTAIVFKPDIILSKERITKDIVEGVDRSKVPMDVIDRQYETFKNNVIYDIDWNGIFDDVIKEKIKYVLSQEFDEIKFID